MKKKAGDPPKKKSSSNASSRASFDSDNAVRRSKATSDNLQKVDRVYREGLKSAGEHNARGIPGREKPYNQVRDEVMPRPKMEYMGKNKPAYLGKEKPRPSPLKPLGPVGRGGGPKKGPNKAKPTYMGATMTARPEGIREEGGPRLPQPQEGRQEMKKPKMGEKPKPKMVTSSKTGISYPMVSPHAEKYAKQWKEPARHKAKAQEKYGLLAGVIGENRRDTKKKRDLAVSQFAQAMSEREPSKESSAPVSAPKKKEFSELSAVDQRHVMQAKAWEAKKAEARLADSTMKAKKSISNAIVASKGRKK